MTRFATGLVAAALVAAPAAAGKFNKVLGPGDPAPAWEGLEGTDGKKHSLADLKDKDVVVVVFTCNSCPTASSYEDRLIPFANKHAGPDAKVAVVAINCNVEPEEDRLPGMKDRAADKKFPYPYLHDPSQEVGKKYGARYTPEFFVLNKDRKVVYMGAMDDKDPPAEPKAQLLEDAVAAALAGKAPAVQETVGRGCLIRYKRKKDDD